MSRHCSALSITLLAILALNPAAASGQPADLKVLPNTPTAAVLAPASQPKVLQRKDATEDCKPGAPPSKCDVMVEQAHALLVELGRNCENCKPKVATIHPQTSPGKGVRVRVEPPDFCQGVTQVALQRGYRVTCSAK